MSPAPTLLPEVTVYLGLGANVGDRARALLAAVSELEESECFRPVRLSSLYETDPVGLVPQGRFLNAVLEGRTALSPFELLDRAEELERRLGRVEKGTGGPRRLDVDLLLHGNTQLRSPRLTVPHPEVGNREFVLAPLAEIAPALHLPDGRSVRGLLERVAGTQGVHRYECPEWDDLHLGWKG
jgi:2-amino-4-hydroxy-6-hydroxymethyldihydropteridine diphosphokinase